MNFAAIPSGASVFVDANVLVYHFSGEATFGPPCTDLIKRIERQEIRGFTSAHALIDVAHRLMTIEAIMDFGWPVANIARRLRRHHSEIPRLLRWRQAIDAVPRIGRRLRPCSNADTIRSSLADAGDTRRYTPF